jgi:hypothetical protein
MGGVRMRSVVLGSLAVAVAFGIYWLVDAPDGEQPELQRSIASAADVAGDGGTIDLAAVADFPWDRVHVINAYTPHDVIASELGFDWQPYSRLGGMLFDDAVLSYDSRQLIVFVRGDRDVTGWIILNLEPEPPYVGFEFEGLPPVLSQDGADFVVEGTPGQNWLLTLASTR